MNKKPYLKPVIKATLKQDEDFWYCEQCSVAGFDLVVSLSSIERHVREHLKGDQHGNLE